MAKKAKKTVAIRDRIKDLRRVKASDLKAHPRNWQEHPEGQRDALRGVLAEIGYAEALVARELPDGTLELINGHLRAEVTPDMEVPVLVVDVSEEEAATLLATMDPIGRLAHTNHDELRALLGDVRPEDASVRELIDDLARGLPSEPGAEGEDDTANAGPADMNLRPHEHYDYVLVLARTSHDWNRLAEFLGLEKIPIGRRRKLGYGRGYPAERLLELLEEAWQAKGRQTKGRPKKPDK